MGFEGLRTKGVIFILGILVSCCLTTMADDHSLHAVATANTEFTSNLYNALRNSMPENLIFSPYSVSAVVAMVKAGARGQTAKDIQKAFKFPDDSQLNEGYKELMHSLNSDGGNFTLETANKIYAKQGFEIKPEYLEIVEKYYGAGVEQLDFSNSAASAQYINDFVSKTTHDKIKDLISPNDLDSLTRLILVNAIYFKGLWKNKFNPALTKEADFNLNKNDKVKVQMMRIEADFPFAEIDELNARAIALPYKGDRLSMIILLPNEIEGLSQMEEKLKTFSLATLPGRLRERKMNLMMPKFTLESTIDLKTPLTELGAGSMFDENTADFSGISESEQLYVSKAVQKAFIEVNEEGSEAAAATGINIAVRSGMRSDRFIVRHPFMAMISDLETSSILFSTRYSNPSETSVTLTRTAVGDHSKTHNGSSSRTTTTMLLPSLFIMPLIALFYLF